MLDKDLLLTAKGILTEFEIGSIINIEKVSTGLIHKTFKVDATAGTYALQMLHPNLSSNNILADYDAVTSFLTKKHFPSPKLVKNRRGYLVAKDAKGSFWRLITWLNGKSYEIVPDNKIVFEGASLLARFHKIMEPIQYKFKSDHPLHKTDYHLKMLKQTSEKFKKTKLYEIIKLSIEKLEDKLNRIIPLNLPYRIVHGDPKISNLLFDEKNNAIALIDLDTCCRHTVIVDIGDAIRSWCREGGEDEETSFCLQRFESLIRGYANEADFLQSNEVDYLPEAGLLITLELASRFLWDFMEDSYFGWDNKKYKSRREHNLARARGMLFLANDMELKKSEILSIIRKYF